MKIGEALRTAREQKGLTYLEVEQETKIRARYLEALEEERFEELPGETYTLGFLRIYASYLGLDPEPLVAAYKAERGAALPQPAPAPKKVPPRERRLPRLPWLPRLFPWLLVLLGLLLLFLYATAAGEKKAREEVPSRGVPAPTAPAPAAEQREETFRLVVAAKEPCWLRAEVDGGEEFMGVLQPGERRAFTAREYVRLRLGNAGGVDLYRDGRKLPPAGGRGEVVEKVFREEGE